MTELGSKTFAAIHYHKAQIIDNGIGYINQKERIRRKNRRKMQRESRRKNRV